jgi:hypothetical protein
MGPKRLLIYILQKNLSAKVGRPRKQSKVLRKANIKKEGSLCPYFLK